MNLELGRRVLVLVGALALTLSQSPPAVACTRALWTDNGKGVVVGRSMDWVSPMPSDLYALPRGVRREGMTGKNTLTWTAKYGSLVVVPRGAGATDGMNEKAFAGHLLWLSESDYGEFDASRPGLSVGLWLQYYLDTFATVKEAVEFTKRQSFQLVSGTFDGRPVTIHMALEDASGDSAVIQYIDGKPRIHHGKQYTVMTNSPPYDEQLRRLKRYEGFGGSEKLPGTTEAADRFVRAAYYVKHLPDPKDDRERIAGILSVMRNVSQPFRVGDASRPEVSQTRWRTVADLTNRVYYFESTTSPNLVWVKLDQLDLSAGSEIRKLDLVQHPDRIGDNSKQFAPAAAFVVPPPDLK